MTPEETGELHADRLFARSDALAESLKEVVKGRPIDVCVQSLALVIGDIAIDERGFFEESVAAEARFFVEASLHYPLEQTQNDRLRFVQFLAYSLALTAVVLRLPKP